MMANHYVIDTNILVYLYDRREAVKQNQAQQVIAHMGAGSRGSIPAQALAEFASVALRKFKPPIRSLQVFRHIETFEQLFPIIPLTQSIVLEAVRGVRDYRMSYYDAQIWAAAKLSQASAVLSEDFTAGQVIEGIRFVNPFVPGFEVSKSLP